MSHLISIVVPCFNEQEVITQTHERLLGLSLPSGYEKEIIYVDDGSKDNTLSLLRTFAEKSSCVRVLSFSRNFGHQPAVTAGTAAAKGDAIVIIDADLQDPPELIPEMIAKWEEGAMIVYGKRTKRKGETAFKKITAWGYYRLLSWLGGAYIPKDTGDFRLIDKQVANTLTNDMKEHHRFLRGMTAWAGYSQVPVEYVRDERAAGETKYTIKKMLRLASDGIVAFSEKPLLLPLSIGAGICFLSFLYLIVSIILVALYIFPSYHILFSIAFLLFGMLFVATGILGMYLARIYDEAKNRPEYIIKEIIEKEADKND